jgi:hypothetical protein
MEVASEVREELRAHRRVVAAGTEHQDDLDGHRGPPEAQDGRTARTHGRAR